MIWYPPCLCLERGVPLSLEFSPPVGVLRFQDGGVEHGRVSFGLEQMIGGMCHWMEEACDLKINHEIFSHETKYMFIFSCERTGTLPLLHMAELSTGGQHGSWRKIARLIINLTASVVHITY